MTLLGARRRYFSCENPPFLLRVTPPNTTLTPPSFSRIKVRRITSPHPASKLVVSLFDAKDYLPRLKINKSPGPSLGGPSHTTVINYPYRKHKDKKVHENKLTTKRERRDKAEVLNIE